MLIQETWTVIKNHNEDNETRYMLGESDLYEPFTDNVGKLFLSLQREYGKCVSKVYVGEDKSIAIGWVFQKMRKYDNEFYLQETRVTLHKDKPTKTVKYHYQELQ